MTLTLHEAARYLDGKLSTRTLRRMVETGKLPALREGRKLLFKAEHLDALFRVHEESHGNDPSVPTSGGRVLRLPSFRAASRPPIDRRTRRNNRDA